MKFTILPVTPYQQNCSLIWCEATGRAALIDPGGDIDRLLAAVERQGVTLEKLLLTHGHLDHVGAAGILSLRLGLPIEGPHREDDFLFDSLPQQSAMFGFPYTEPFQPSRWLSDGDRISLGNETLEVIHCPGHTPGHIVFFHRGQRLAFVGDVLFKGSIGRTDFPRGDYDSLIGSIRNKLWPLGDDVEFVPGHGLMSSFGAERRDNPFVGDNA
ncbi:glyoxylase-like metal-dependent hydrolase (beta-lactamase superfamily II) [Sulfuritortus calidifontis]|uniref:Glyoxylase-like metal-dependent hydrolase (Beta-lactamase superfamily II) n=1 Tax=Sulfuritortus calidifontis TaxID=1914471 RepID=A0A4R3K0M7_9PROT|nr:MBL fold metallo-hydrolase [Sulfuritortus calidifontis]TCS73802.1 glyoxylase-like metal-dependent hydrolase (beta-lactamase superfamily II) [Sulfuritortus calidifontis]